MNSSYLGSAEEKAIPLQSAQKSMYIFEKNHPGTTTYHHTVAIQLSGPVDQKTFSQALEMLVDRHEALRCKIVESQQADTTYLDPINLHVLPLKFINAQQTDMHPLNEMATTCQQLSAGSVITSPFILNEGPLWRCVFISFGTHTHQVLMVFHHIIVDVASQNIILSDLSELYNSLMYKIPIQLPPLQPLHQISLAINQEENSRVSPTSALTQKMDYWKKKLNEVTPLCLHTDQPAKSGARSFNGSRVFFTIDTSLSQALNTIALTNHVKIHTVIFAGLYVLLHHLTGETDLCLGTASANRRHVNISHAVNSFVNSIPVRINLASNPRLSDLFALIYETAKEAYAHQAPIHKITDAALSNNNSHAMLSGSPFNIIYVLNEEKSTLNLTNVEATLPIELDLGHCKFEYFGINLDKQRDESYAGFIEFNSDLFNQSSIVRLKDQLLNLLMNIAKNPTLKITDLSLLTEQDLNLLNICNPPFKRPLFNDFIHNRLSQYAIEIPQSTATAFHQESGTVIAINYKTLHHITNQLATLLISKGIKPEVRVGICLNRSLNPLIAFYSVLKSGGVAVPLDTLETPESLAYKIHDAELKVIIVDNKTQSLFNNIASLNLINIADPTIAETNHPQPTPNLSPENIAYIEYTSGTTGKPKGVCVPHQALSNQLNSIITDRQLKQGIKVLSIAPFTFDASIFEFLEALSTGGEVHYIYDEGHTSSLVLKTVMNKAGIEAATFLPTMLNSFLPEECPTLKDIITMGAAPASKQLQLWLSNNKELRNECGWTEAGPAGTIHKCKINEPFKCIGKPITNMAIYIVNTQCENYQHECGINEIGELWIAGPNLAHSYLNQHTLTQQKFIHKLYHPKEHYFEDLGVRGEVKYEDSTQKDGVPLRLYRTGDLGYRLADGSIVHDGRLDTQVKIRGTRIELDGVAECLREHPRIQDAHLLPGKDSLIAFIILKQPNNTPLGLRELNRFLRKNTQLPRVTNFSYVTCLPSFPLNKNGKIDNHQLNEIASRTPMSLEKPPEPDTKIQKILKKIIHGILGTQLDIRLDEEFQDELNLNSLQMGKLERKINTTFFHNTEFFPAAPIRISDLYHNNTILKLESLIIEKFSFHTALLIEGRIQHTGKHFILDEQQQFFNSPKIPSSPTNHSPIQHGQAASTGESQAFIPITAEANSLQPTQQSPFLTAQTKEAYTFLNEQKNHAPSSPTKNKNSQSTRGSVFLYSQVK